MSFVGLHVGAVKAGDRVFFELGFGEVGGGSLVSGDVNTVSKL